MGNANILAASAVNVCAAVWLIVCVCDTGCDPRDSQGPGVTNVMPGFFYWIGDRLMVGRLALNEAMLVRFQLPEVDWLGRQLEDHPLSKRGMLRVQIPPEPLLLCRLGIGEPPRL